jgi:RNA polymerase sigma factor (sigma-70 family)
MSHQISPQQLTLTGIAHRCAVETTRFFQRKQSDPQYCFELFRRAIVERNEGAWEIVYAQYRPLVIGWIQRHAAFANSGEDADYFVNRALEKFWIALTPEKFKKMRNLKALLRYLQMCVHSVILDYVRGAKQATVGLADEVLTAASSAREQTPEEQAVDQMQRQAFWRQIDERLHNEKERRVVYASFVLALKPRQIHAQFPDLFRDVREVYRVKENVLARLRRDAELKQLLGEDA